MGIIYNKQTATCLLEFQAAYRHWDLSPSIFTFQLWLNKHDKYTLTHTHTAAGLILIRPSLPRSDGTDFMQKLSAGARVQGPDSVPEKGFESALCSEWACCRLQVRVDQCVCVERLFVCVCERPTERGTEIVTPGNAATALRRRLGIQTYLHVPRPEPHLTSQQLLIMNWPAEKSTELWICKTRRSGQGPSNTRVSTPTLCLRLPETSIILCGCAPELGNFHGFLSGLLFSAAKSRKYCTLLEEKVKAFCQALHI